jgi:hypothetical protein
VAVHRLLPLPLIDNLRNKQTSLQVLPGRSLQAPIRRFRPYVVWMTPEALRQLKRFGGKTIGERLERLILSSGENVIDQQNKAAEEAL